MVRERSGVTLFTSYTPPTSKEASHNREPDSSKITRTTGQSRSNSERQRSRKGIFNEKPNLKRNIDTPGLGISHSSK